MDGPHGGGDGSILELGHHQVHLSLCLGIRLGRVQHPDSGPQLPWDFDLVLVTMASPHILWIMLKSAERISGGVYAW